SGWTGGSRVQRRAVGDADIAADATNAEASADGDSGERSARAEGHHAGCGARGIWGESRLDAERAACGRPGPSELFLRGRGHAPAIARGNDHCLDERSFRAAGSRVGERGASAGTAGPAAGEKGVAGAWNDRARGL